MTYVVQAGEVYAITVPDHDAPLILDFPKRLSRGILVFVKPGTDREFRVHQSDLSMGRATRSPIRAVGDGGPLR
jgi:hypothetical protein